MKLVLLLIAICLIQGFSAKIDGYSENQKKHAELIEAEESFIKSISRINWRWLFNKAIDIACSIYPDDWNDCFECSKGTYLRRV